MIDEIWTISFDEAKEFAKTLKSDSLFLQRVNNYKIGNLEFERVRIIINGDDEENIYKKFKLRFMRCGG